MGRISTHVLDSSLGAPGAGISAKLDLLTPSGWEPQGGGTTDSDGRINSFSTSRDLENGAYRLTFITDPYFHANDRDSFYPEVVVVFAVTQPKEDYHIPLILGPFGYTTYRGR